MADTYPLKKNRKQPSTPETSTAGKRSSGRTKARPSVSRGSGGRLVSLDAYRGFIMTMLAASGFGIARLASLPQDAPAWNTFDFEKFQTLAFHFRHPAWESIFGDYGVAFWDLIQPAFMFMVGVAMPFSYARRSGFGDSDVKRTLHAGFRAVVLVLLGVFLYSQNAERTNWIFTNVLAQIGLGYFFAYMLLGRKLLVQLSALSAILIGNWLMFYMNPPPEDYDYAAVGVEAASENVYEGRFAAWSKNSNIAFHFDSWLLPKLRSAPEPTPTLATEPETAAAIDSEPKKDVPDQATPDESGLDTPESDAETTGNVAPEDSVDSNEPDESDSSDTGNDQPAESELDAVGDSSEAIEPEEPAAPAAESRLRLWFASNPAPYEPNRGGYTTLNFIPSIATMLLGVLCGQLLLFNQSRWKNLLTLIIAAAICLGLGILAHHTVCPIVKKIWTPSWALFSGGYVILMLAVFYFVFDILPLRWLAFPLVVVGMNSLMFYMLGQLLRPWVTNKIIHIHLAGFLNDVCGPSLLADDGFGRIAEPTGAFIVFWLVGLWMYRNKYFVRV